MHPMLKVLVRGATEGKGSLTLEHIICAYINKVNMSNRSVT